MKTAYQVPIFLLMAVLGSSRSICQSPTASEVQALADSAIKKLQWRVWTQGSFSVMSLEIPYEMGNETYGVDLDVAKPKEATRPEFILVRFPSTVDKKQGCFIAFSKTVKKDGQWSMELAKGTTIRLDYDMCDSNICSLRIIKGYARNSETGEYIDVFKEFLEYDHALFLIYQHGEHKSVTVPLFSFKDQYRKLD